MTQPVISGVRNSGRTSPPWMDAWPTSENPSAAWKASDAGLGGSELTSQTTMSWPLRGMAEQILVEPACMAAAARGRSDRDPVDIDEARIARS